MAATAEFSQALAEAEKALEIDRRGGYGYFADPLNRARLFYLNFLYQLAARTVEKERGNGAAIEFIENKLQLFRYLPSTPMIFLLKHLAARYVEAGQPEQAQKCLRTILDAESVLKGDDEGKEQELRAYANRTIAALAAPVGRAETPPEQSSRRRPLQASFVGWWAYYFWVGYLAPSQLSWACKLVPEFRDRT